MTHVNRDDCGEPAVSETEPRASAAKREPPPVKIVAGLGEDARLLLRLRAGDSHAMDELVHRHYARVFNLALRLTGNPEDAQDLVSETFIRAYRSVLDFRGEAHFATWLHSIARNVFLSDCKRRRRRDHQSLEQLVELDDNSVSREVVDPSPGPAFLTERRAFAEAVQEAVQTLPESQRVMVVLYHFQHLSYEEIAAIMETPVGTVKSRLNRARLALKGRLRHIRERA